MSLLIDNPEQPFAQLLLAHGAGANKDSEFMQTMAKLLCERGIRVVRFDFPYMLKAQQLGRRQPPNRMPILLQDFAQKLQSLDDDLPIFVGGKSMGGRVATMLPELAKVRGIVCMGYPFHPPKKPEKHRTEHLYSLTKPLCIVQGERDTFGNKSTIQEYQLPSTIKVTYLAAADHSFVPLKSSGQSLPQHMQTSADCIDYFIKGLL